MAKKKKYYQSPKARKQESKGMKNYWKDEFLSPVDVGKRTRLEDSEMIREDHMAMANLPQQVMIKPYRKPRYGHLMGIDDTITGIDIQIGDDSDEMKKHSYPEKY